MTTAQQKYLLALLASGKYRVDTEQGCVYSYRKNKDSWERVAGTILPSGYRQLKLFTGKKLIRQILIYEHLVVFIAGHGLIPKAAAIVHRDKDKGNNKLWNLDLEVQDGPEYPEGKEGKILKLQDLWESGERNHTRLSEAVLLDRQAIRRMCLRMEQGKSPVDKNRSRSYSKKPWLPPAYLD